MLNQYTESRKGDSMGNAVAEKTNKKRIIPTFTTVQARFSLEERGKIEEAEIISGRRRKELIRSAIRWLPTVNHPIEKSKKEGDFSEFIKFEVLPKERQVLETIAIAQGVNISDALRWIVNNLDWIIHEI